MDANVILIGAGSFLGAIGGFMIVVSNVKKTYTETAAKTVETVFKIVDRQDKIIDKQTKDIEAIKEFYKSENNGLKENQNIMHKKIEDLQHTYNTSLTQDRMLLTKTLEENTIVLKKTNHLIEELKSKKA